MKYLILALFFVPPAFARAKINYDGYWRNSPYVCDNGRTYELRGRSIYVDGIPAMNNVYYEMMCSLDNYDCSVWENSFKQGMCRPMNQPRPPATPKRYDNYVKVCDPHCRWETRELN